MAKLQSVGSVAGKETIYVDVDDEITAIIDKVSAAKSKVVALVLPKRATVLQSIVNMKLLKRTADSADKNLVLVTSEAGLMPLAGAVGLHVASTPTSKPSIPAAPAGPDDEPEDVDEPLDIVDSTADDEEFDPGTAGNKTVGELAAAGAASKLAADDVDEQIDMNDDEGDAPAATAATAAAVKPKKNKKLKVPNFDSFRQKVALGVVLLLALIGLWILAAVVLPHATITIATDSSDITSNLNLTLDTTAKVLDTTNNIVPATAQTQQKTSTTTVPATGQQNNGDKASGSVTLSITKCAPNLGQPDDLPTGSSLTANSHTYITQEKGKYTHSALANGSCIAYSTDPISIQALKGGADYNVSNASFKSGTGASGTGSATGGTDDITKIVQQSDIDGATAKIKSSDSSNVKQQLVSGLQGKGLFPVDTTFVAGDPQVTTSAQAGSAADNVTVTAVTTYTMLGVKKSDLKTLVVNNVNGQLDKGKQVILDDGVNNASFTEPSPATATGAQVSMQTKSVAGPDLNVANLKKQLAGKKSGDVKNIVGQTPGVTNVSVKFSPFWVNSVPKHSSKVKIVITKASS